MPRPTPEELEKLIHQTLRSLPDRPAPRSLETRVLAAIEARQALPWWRQSFVHWPLAARGAFLLVTAFLAAVLIGLGFHTESAVESTTAFSGSLAFVAHLKVLWAGVSNLGHLLTRNIPTYWVYGTITFVVVMYTTLIGLGATAYRLFFHQR